MTFTPSTTEHTNVQVDGGQLGTRYAGATVTYAYSTGAGAMTAHYQEDTAPNSSATDSASLTQITANLNDLTVETVARNGLLFQFAGVTYTDRAGTLYRDIDPATGAGTQAGSIDYSTGIATLTDWDAGAPALSILAMLLEYQPWVTDHVYFRTSGSPLRTGSLSLQGSALDGSLLSGDADQSGTISGTGTSGTVDVQMGIVSVTFDQPVYPETITYNAVILSYLPLDADILGLSPVRLPSDGRVPIVRNGDVVVVHHEDTTAFPDPVSSGQTVDMGRTRLAYLQVEDATGAAVDTALYTADLDAGTVTMADPLDLSAYTQPLVGRHRVEDMSLVTDVQITGHITLMRPISHTFPATETRVSSALITGDLQARVSDVFDQTTWTGVFSDSLIGDEPTAEYNLATYPIEVTNRGAITERWALIFTGATAFKVVGESVGQIAVGDTSTQCAPTNPNTGVPYFTIDPLGWGSGWSAGNVLRLNTIGATFPLWIARTVLQGSATGQSDHFRIQIRGNANQ